LLTVFAVYLWFWCDTWPNCNEPNKPDSKFCAKCRNGVNLWYGTADSI